MKAGIALEAFNIGLLKSYRDFSNFVITNKPNYIDEDFNFENFIRYLNSQYESYEKD